MNSDFLLFIPFFFASTSLHQPDWFVGVSDLELCTPHGQWIESKEINLYPYDAGTDSGPAYTSPDQPTYPSEAIRRIKPNNPNDPRSPFYDAENKEMKPLAKLYITRQRLYEKTCENDEEDGGDDSRNFGDGDEEADNGNCATDDWSEFSDCK
jgi:spondin-1